MKNYTLLLLSLFFISSNSFTQNNPGSPVSPILTETDLVTFSIITNGKRIPDQILVRSITIHKEIGKIDFAEIVVLDGNAVEESFEVSESTTFEPGAAIEIKLGYHAQNETVFKGWVVKQTVLIDGEQGSYLKVVCYDKNQSIEKAETVETSLSPPELVVSYGLNIFELELSLDARNQASELTKFRGFVRFQGSAKANVNTLLRMEGLGKRFNGNHFISGVKHILENGTWVTEAKIGVSPK